jgi:hypothetical protein
MDKKICTDNKNNDIVELIEKKMRMYDGYNEETIFCVVEKVHQILESLHLEYENQIKRIILKKLEYKDSLCHNVIDFVTMKKNINIHQSGKIMDMILHSVYGVSRGQNVDVPENMDEIRSFIKFDIDCDEYMISREKYEGSYLEKVVFEKNGQNISGHDMNETNAMIEKHICEYDMFRNILMLSQNRNNFIDLPSEDKIDLILHMLKLDVFSKIVSGAKTLKYENNALIKDFKKKGDSKKIIKTLSKCEKIKSIKQHVDDYEKKMRQYNYHLS